jgi:hypothetical protein
VREAGLRKLSADCRWDWLEELASSWTFTGYILGK